MTAGYQDRVLDEYSQLEERTASLSEFVNSEEFNKLTLQEQSYLEAQLPLMQKLLAVLGSRVAAQKMQKENKKDGVKAAPVPQTVVSAVKVAEKK